MYIFEYDSYKAFLRAYISNLPKGGRGEINRIAEFLPVHPTLISQILNGSRDFSAEQIHKLCSYLGLSPIESDFMILLLQYERAGTVEFKKYYKTKLDELKKSSLSVAKRLQKHRTLNDTEKSIFYSNWIYMAVWLLTSIDGCQTLEAIAHKLAISRAKASEILNFLKEVSLCSENEGIYQMKSQHIHVEFGSAFLSRHHTNWRIKSLQRVDDLSEEELMFTSPFSVSKKDFSRIREEILKVIKSTSPIIRESPAEDIACLNLELFWIKK